MGQRAACPRLGEQRVQAALHVPIVLLYRREYGGREEQSLYPQDMPNKRYSRFGIKKFELSDALTGYVLHVELYAGKDFPIQSDMGQAHSVVMKLLREANVLNKSYHLFADNFYTKPVLVNEPSAANTLLTGTVRDNSRGLPVLPGRLDIGESVNYRSGDMLLIAWREKTSQKKPVLVLSTREGAGMREVRTGAGRLKLKPKSVIAYNKYMVGWTSTTVRSTTCLLSVHPSASGRRSSSTSST